MVNFRCGKLMPDESIWLTILVKKHSATNVNIPMPVKQIKEVAVHCKRSCLKNTYIKKIPARGFTKKKNCCKIKTTIAYVHTALEKRIKKIIILRRVCMFYCYGL